MDRWAFLRWVSLNLALRLSWMQSSGQPKRGRFPSLAVVTPQPPARSTTRWQRLPIAARVVVHLWSFWKARCCQESLPSVMRDEADDRHGSAHLSFGGFLPLFMKRRG